jgi:putative addiction module killer protein
MIPVWATAPPDPGLLLSGGLFGPGAPADRIQALDKQYLIRYICAVKTVIYYAAPSGASPFREWLASLKDKVGANAVLSRLSMVAMSGHFGDHKRLRGSEGVHEMRIHAGPGYRVYYGLDGETIVVILAGGLKRGQAHDMRRAAGYWREYLLSKED